MPAPVPRRNRKVYFVGAGVSTALGLPNTPSLIDAVVEFSKAKQWLQSERLPKRLQAAFRYFYPDAVNQGFKPDVVDFFSSLRTYLDIGAGLVGGFKDAANLDRSLRFAIAHLLIDRMHNAEPRMEAGHSFVDQIVQPGIIRHHIKLGSVVGKVRSDEGGASPSLGDRKGSLRGAEAAWVGRLVFGT